MRSPANRPPRKGIASQNLKTNGRLERIRDEHRPARTIDPLRGNSRTSLDRQRQGGVVHAVHDDVRHVRALVVAGRVLMRLKPFADRLSIKNNLRIVRDEHEQAVVGGDLTNRIRSRQQNLQHDGPLLRVRQTEGRLLPVPAGHGLTVGLQDQIPDRNIVADDNGELVPELRPGHRDRHLASGLVANGRIGAPLKPSSGHRLRDRRTDARQGLDGAAPEFYEFRTLRRLGPMRRCGISNDPDHGAAELAALEVKHRLVLALQVFKIAALPFDLVLHGKTSLDGDAEGGCTRFLHEGHDGFVGRRIVNRLIVTGVKPLAQEG